LAAMINGIGRVTVKFGTAHPEALGGREHPFAAFAGSGRVCYSHILSEI
jgi:hypothetical protein